MLRLVPVGRGELALPLKVKAWPAFCHVPGVAPVAVWLA